MAEEFLSDSSGFERQNSESEMPERESIRFMIISSREGVIEQIHKLYAHGFASVDEWSPVTPVPSSDLMMTILIRYRKIK